jgi:flagellar biosynthesis protein
LRALPLELFTKPSALLIVIIFREFDMIDKRRKAAAISYKPEKDAAPKIIAKGSGAIAEKIVTIAKEHNIPLRDDPQLVEMLSALDLYQEIPPDLYRAVAEVLAFVYKMTKKVS